MKRKLLIGAVCVAAVALTVQCSAYDVNCVYEANGHDVTWSCDEYGACGICETYENNVAAGVCVHNEHLRKYKLQCCEKISSTECTPTASYGLRESIEELTINFINK